ncbi:ABC transporter ATP-binding protein [Fervidicoccus fontis]|uniref:ABC transporter ATP-binding protein n=1 Tax=Fervidicoccus fontis TaxID=683846 RepID=A0A7C2VB88_9CREN|nr:ABC transporter ATP-binding protein [Fervidicoccus fontis]PMB78019.1 MAG: ABC transporter ATP-binding protein [Fervidicoccus fontis]HEW64444.1 ABC transporter ATP-binding protein [Fervidicoccus fontis]
MTLRLENLRKRYGQFELRIEEYTFKEKSYNVVLGSSGSGKTTTLRLIAGLELPDEGKIILDGVDITNVPAWKRDIGLVFQNYALYPHLTAYENISVPLKIKKLDRKTIDEKVKNVAEILGISSELHKYPHQLSGGQQQRVAIARALVKEPKILLLDEPLSNLDARLRLEVRVFLKELQRKLNMTVIHVTHDQEEAMAIADNIVILNSGKIVQDGSPAEIYRKPKNTFIFTFIGLSNLLPASFFGIDDADLVGFRPEDAEIVNADGDISGLVEEIQYLGAYKLLEISIDEKHSVIVRVPPSEEISEGQKVGISIPRDLMLKFKNEERVPQ